MIEDEGANLWISLVLLRGEFHPSVPRTVSERAERENRDAYRETGGAAA